MKGRFPVSTLVASAAILGPLVPGGCFVFTGFDGYARGDGDASCPPGCDDGAPSPPDSSADDGDSARGAGASGGDAAGGDAADASPPGDASDSAPLPDGSDAEAPPPPASCTGVPNGYFCTGDQIKNGIAGTLYECASGQIVAAHTCANGCAVSPPPSADTCKSGAGQAASCAGIPNGWYCGSDRIHGEANVLFHCSAGYVDRQAFCQACVTKPAGTNDVCQ